VAAVLEVVNDAAQAYAGVIPADCWHEQYMEMAELERETRDGVRFWAWQDDGGIAGVMGIQDRGDVELIRHAYVKTAKRNHGIGAALLQHLLSREETTRLLKKYWRISDRQVETSVVLANQGWRP
jgi:GNAT superfamily N-acetyltransferase